jgi:hypothetical protein
VLLPSQERVLERLLGLVLDSSYPAPALGESLHAPTALRAAKQMA